ncbi:MAG TPA: hypothetical protein VJ998_01265, partial [Pseudomonadales bacterium]|nr:hypothetical protein [Pseudomonadales bacterium]
SCVALSRRLAANINGAAVINPVNLVATALLSTSRQTIDRNRLLHQLTLLRNLVSGVPGYGETIVTSMEPAAMVEEAVRVAGIEHVEQPFGDIIMSSPSLTVLLTWYRNNTAHMFAIPSLLARIVRAEGRVSLNVAGAACETLYPYFQSEFFMKWHRGDLAAAVHFYVDRLATLGLLTMEGKDLVAPEPASEQFASLSDLGEIIEPTLERFYVVTSLLTRRTNSNIKDVENDAATIARQMSSIFSINSPEFFERSLFSTLIGSLRANGVVETREHSIWLHEGKLESILHTAESTLSPNVRYNVLQAIERTSAPQTRPSDSHAP